MPSRADALALSALLAGRFVVHAEQGEIWTPAGSRAEYLDRRLAYGRVVVSKQPMALAMAHRMVWMSVHGAIPPGLQINHINRLRWDNRIANLELVTPRGNARHWRDLGYEAIGQRDDAVPTDWLDRLDNGTAQPEQINPYARHPGAL